MARIDLNTDNIEILREAERIAYANGDTDKALLIARVIELLEETESLKQQIGDTVTLEEWEKRNGPAGDYVQFFEDCFEHMNGHYPCPSVTSDYDKSVIFEAILRGEENKEQPHKTVNN